MKTLFSRFGRTMTAVSAMFTALLVASPAWAQDAAASAGNNPHAGMMTLALALGVSIAAFGGTIGQSRAAAAALEGIARNPNAAEKLGVPMLLSLAFIESLVLFTWVLMFLLRDKI